MLPLGYSDLEVRLKTAQIIGTSNHLMESSELHELIIVDVAGSFYFVHREPGEVASLLEHHTTLCASEQAECPACGSARRGSPPALPLRAPSPMG